MHDFEIKGEKIKSYNTYLQVASLILFWITVADSM